MPDRRFFEALGPVSVADLAALAGAELTDASLGARLIERVAPLGRAAATDVGFLSDARYRADLSNSGAGAVFLRPSDVEKAPPGAARLVTKDPQAAYCRASARLHRPRLHTGEAAIHPEAVVEEGALLAPGVVVGPGARIGAGTQIGPNTVIGPGVSIGRRGRIGANVSIAFALVGDDVQIFSGAVIGEPGFGVAGHGGDVIDVPQLGRVILQDHVTIGACTCIDRGAWDDTVIGEHTKIDNLVQIAHNVRIGRNCVIAAHTGMSGSVTVGDGAMFGGQVGIADHLHIAPGAKVAARAGVMKDVPAGEVWGGLPAKPLRRWMREVTWLSHTVESLKNGGKE